MASGTAPNTSIILTDNELEYINYKFNGKKSAAIHTALEEMMNSDTVFLSEDNAGGLLVGNDGLGWWDVTALQNESSFADDAKAILDDEADDWTVDHYESAETDIVARYSNGTFAIVQSLGTAAERYIASKS